MKKIAITALAVASITSASLPVAVAQEFSDENITQAAVNKCSGINLAIAIDASLSLTDDEMRKQQNALNGLIDKLSSAEGGTQLSLFGYAGKVFSQELNISLPQDKDKAKNYVSSLVDRSQHDLGEGTSWRSPLKAIEDTGIDFQSVILSSDGVPDNVEYAREIVDRLKSKGTRVVSILVGERAGEVPAKNPNTHPHDYSKIEKIAYLISDTPVVGEDYFGAENITALERELNNAIGELCGAEINNSSASNNQSNSSGSNTQRDSSNSNTQRNQTSSNNNNQNNRAQASEPSHRGNGTNTSNQETRSSERRTEPSNGEFRIVPGTVGVDLDNDGVFDVLGIDKDGDGVVDIIDYQGDGKYVGPGMSLSGIAEPQGVGIDTDGDGVVDAIALDVDGDGIIDGIDSNGDGKIDYTLTSAVGDEVVGARVNAGGKIEKESFFSKIAAIFA